MPETIKLFTKPACPFCAAAKITLEERGHRFAECDITSARRTAALSVYLTGVATVPQILVGDLHINGSEDLQALAEAGRLDRLIACAEEQPDTERLSDAELEAGTEDLPLSRIIPESDGTRSDDPEQWPILHFYKSFFGFWPNCFRFMHHWPEAYKLFVYAHNLGAIRFGREVLGERMMMATGFATSDAHGCNYCRIHMTAAGGETSLGLPALMQQVRSGKAGDNAEMGVYELALTELAAEAARNAVPTLLLEEIRSLASQARESATNPEDAVMATAMVTSAFGFLNVFNDLTGVDVEREWAGQAQSRAGIEPGRHAVSTHSAYGNLDHPLSEGGPSLEDMLAACDGVVAKAGGVERYAMQELGLLPSWMKAWPEDLRARHALFYAEMMQPRAHSSIPSELKHLMARVSAIAKGHEYLAAVEGWMACQVAGQTQQAVERVRHCFEAAKQRKVGEDCFTEQEGAALTLAWLSAQSPLTTPRRFIEPAIQAYTARELVQLITVCSVAGLVQRFAAITKPVMEPEVSAYLQEHALESDTLCLRYPDPALTRGRASRSEVDGAR
ncbi:glutaredoxin domain-containing protein [Fodinicurvata sediminis]|uniref:glutaredoxin domain-containing protein n=1 Tax=Fodinicurvata sediminis TaxID=1121832 RepID=UPI0003B66B6C|nr:glutaredoxin domain-containing protein [Fodinicurvata sediminis]